MFRSYLQSALRSLSRNKFYAFINIAGLSAGIMASIFILLFIRDELTYDKHHEKYNRIYRIGSHFSINAKDDKFAVSSLPIGPAFKLEFPEVEEFVRFARRDDIRLRTGEKEFAESNVYLCDSTVFGVFSHEMLMGNPDKALTEPFTIVLSESMAQKYFGDENPMGKTITDNSDINYSVTGVFRDLPANVHLRYDALISGATMVRLSRDNNFNSLEPIRFWNVGLYTYILLKENADAENLNRNFPPFYAKYMEPIGKQINATFQPILTRLDKIHHYSHLEGDLPTGNRAYIYIFAMVAVFILVLASINYMNLATARAVSRSREVGIRKVLGAYRSQLMRQFFGESLLLVILGLMISLVLVYLLLPVFNQLSGKELAHSALFTPEVLGIAFVVSLVTGIGSGMYPALYLSSFEPTTVLKGISTGRRRATLRKALVVFQFVIAIVMIIGTFSVGSQLNYLKSKDLGFNSQNVIIASVTDSAFRRNIGVLRDELLKNPNITEVATSTGVPGNMRSIVVMRIEQDGKMEDRAINFAFVDSTYIDLMGLEIVKGRKFHSQMQTDLDKACIINEAAAEKFGWGDDALGKKIDFGINLDGTADVQTKVIGVVKNFHYVSLHNSIEPFVIFLARYQNYFLSIRITGHNMNQTIEYIRDKWAETGAKQPFDYQFLDKSFEEMYQAEAKLGSLFNLASGLSIFVALLGLLGLSSFVTSRRTKEIGIRKVLGAPMGLVATMLYREFAVLILLAFVVAAPVATWLMNLWLANFAYHTQLNWGIYLAAGLLSLGVAMLTSTWHIIKTATSNPVEAIKYE